MCCKGKEIPYKDYTPQDQLRSRQMYNQGARNVYGQGATTYGMGNENAPLFAQMNPLHAMAMQAMFQQGGGQGQMQMPGYGTYGMMNSGIPQAPGSVQSQAGGGFGGPFGGQYGGLGWQNQFPGVNSGGGANPGGQGGQPQVPFWLMMPGQGGQPQGGGMPQ